MNYLSVENLSKSYGDKVLFNNISFGIGYGEKVALIAKNGTGKTTLMRVIAGKDQGDKGSIVLRKDIKVAVLDQDPQFDLNSSILDVIFAGDSKELKAISEYELSVEAVEHDPSDNNLNRLHRAQSAMDELNAWDYETRTKQILSKLNIHDLDRTIATLSGGQKKRIALAKVLVQEPHLLIMDEPTNHLDIEMTEWLEGYLGAREDMSLLLVTHDRYFLDRVCNEIIELDNGNLYRYKGNYSYFIEKKAEREFNEASEIDKARNLYRRELEWVRKMPKARTTKSKSRVDAFDDIKAKALQKKNEQKVKMEINMSRLGGKILELEHVNKAFGDLCVLKDFSYVFKTGEKIGIVGKNGVGKSTFLNMIMGLEKPDNGSIQSGETVVFGYYSQNGMLNADNKRVIEVIKDIAEYIPLKGGAKLTASQLLNQFLFPPEAQYSLVGKLSGGEKRRLYLLTLLIKNPNFLILDEPTNDLDIQTLSTLEEFLVDFQGCLLVVTHDRYFMDRLVDHVFAFEGDGIVKDYPGNYSEYREYLELEKEEEKLSIPVVAEKVEAVPQVATPTSPSKKMTFKEKFEFEQLEKELPVLEKKKAELEAKLAAGIDDTNELMKASQEFDKVNKELDEKSFRWLELSEIQ